MHHPFLRIFAFGLLLTNPLSARPEGRPNVIFIITDDQRSDDFGFLRGKALTPNIDRLANDGTFFKNSYTCSTVCTPSRYACITGRYPSRSSASGFIKDITPEGVTQVYFNTHLEPKRPNLPKALQAAGYTTGLVGKWHLGNYGGPPPKIPKGADPKNPAIRQALAEYQLGTCEKLKQHGFDYVSRIYLGNLDGSGPLHNAGLAHHNMEWVTEGALDFIDSKKDQPFFLYFSTTLAHSPDKIASMEEDPRATPVGFLETPPMSGMPSRDSIFEQVEKAGFPRDTAHATWLDAGIGSILSKLKELGIAENTLIIYFNDHGMEYNSKSSLYQGSTRTPGMAYWPGTIKAQVCDELVTNVDIAPTIMDACSAKPLPDMPLDGMSYLPLAEGKTIPWRDAVYSEIGFTRAIITKDWKYLAFRLPPSQVPSPEDGLRQQIEMLDSIKKQHSWVKWQADPAAKVSHIGGPPGGNFLVRLTLKSNPPYIANYFDADQLYDLTKDPLERTNLSNNPEYTAQFAAMKKLLKAELDELPGTFGDLKPEAGAEH